MAKLDLPENRLPIPASCCSRFIANHSCGGTNDFIFIVKVFLLFYFCKSLVTY